MPGILGNSNLGRSVVDQRFGGHREYYELAFAAEYRAIWNGVPFVRESNDEIASLAYYRALMSFYDRDPVAIVDRRKLLYAYVSELFSTKDDDSLLNRYRKSLPVDSGIRRVVRNLATAYDEPPKRSFSEDSTSPTQIEMARLYSEMNAAASFQQIHRRARLVSLVAVRPYVVDGTMRVDFMTPDNFRVITSPTDVQTPVEIWFPKIDAEVGLVYERWTRASRRLDRETGGVVETPGVREIVDGDGNVLDQMENPYGILPFAFLRTDDDLQTYPGGMLELVEAQLDANKTKFLANTNVDFASSPAWFGINLRATNLRISPDRLLAYDNVIEGDGMPVPPSLEAISPDGKFAELDEFRANRERRQALAEGIPPSMLTDQVSTPPSGISRVVERSEIIDLRNSELPALRRFEEEFAKIVATVSNVDAGTSIDIDSIVVSIDFAEERIYVEPDAEYNSDKQRMNDGVLDPREFYRKWSGFDSAIEEDELVRIVTERATLVRRIEEAKSGAPADAAPTEEPTADDNSANDPEPPEPIS